MPCCSANDINANVIQPALLAEPDAATTDAATTDAATTYDATAAARPDCPQERCRNEELGLGPCPPGICRRDKDGKPAKDHPRPPCPQHGD